MPKAFTLIELLIVIALLGILSSIGVVTFTGHIASSHKKKAEVTINSIYLAQSEYQSNNSEYCISDCNTQDKIVKNLLDEVDNLKDQNYNFTILNTSDGYTIQARHKTSSCTLTLTHKSVKRESGC